MRKCPAGGQDGVHSKRHEGISLMCLNFIKSQLGEGKKGNLGQRPAFPHWCTWSPRGYGYSLFVEDVEASGKYEVLNI